MKLDNGSVLVGILIGMFIGCGLYIGLDMIDHFSAVWQICG
jgi:hypothetical protein